MNLLDSLSLQETTLSSALLGLSKNGILVFEYVLIPTPTFRVKQANAHVQQLAEGFPASLVGAYLEQLPAPFNSPYLTQQLQWVLAGGATTRFQLIHPINQTGSLPIYDCQVVPIDKQMLVLSVEVVPFPPDDSKFQQQILEALPTGLIIFRAVRNETGDIVDFQATLCNQTGADISQQSREDILTRPISERYKDMQAFDLFHQYVAVVRTGKPHYQIQYLPRQDIWLDISVVKFADGLLVSFQNVTMGQKTASLLESVMNSSPAAVRYYESVRDDSGQIIDFITSTGNELAAYRPFRPVQSTTGKRLLELYPYLKLNGLFDRYVTVVETGESDHFETSYPANTIASTTVWFDCTAVRHGNGFVLTTLDITARKQAQLAQQQQAHLLQTVLDNSLTGMAWLRTMCDSAGEIVDFVVEKLNETLAQTLRRSPQAIEGQTLSALMPHQMANGLFKRYADVAQTGQAQRFEWSNTDGNIWYDISVISFDDGIIVTFLDITAIKLAQLSLEQQAELVAGVLNNSPSSILVLEAIDNQQGSIHDFRIALTNPATLNMLLVLLGKPLTSEDLITHTIREFLPFLPVSKEQETFQILVDVVNTRQPTRRQVDFSDLDRSYDYEITPFRNGVLVITTDITPLRQYQKKLEENNAALSRSNEHLQQFAYIASHDLQEPLRKIQSFGNLLQSQYADRLDEGVHYLERMQAASSRMSTLIRDLLVFSRISTHQDATAPVSLNQVITTTLTDLELVIQETSAEVNVRPLPTVRGDQSQLGQLFQNLLSNALKFRQVDHSGVPVPPLIRISSHTVAASDLPSSVKPTRLATAYYRIDVSDNGIGFDARYVDRIFQVFQRLHGKNEFAGTGVGLAICEKVTANHGGAITASSEPGQGATFQVYLPVAVDTTV